MRVGVVVGVRERVRERVRVKIVGITVYGPVRARHTHSGFAV